MKHRSILNAQEDCVTFQITMTKAFYSISIIYNILTRFLPTNISNNIKGMRTFVDNTGACFDVSVHDMERFEDIFKHEAGKDSADFKVSRCLALPELKEEANIGGGGYG